MANENVTMNFHNLGSRTRSWLRTTAIVLWSGLFVAWTVMLLVPVPPSAVTAVGGATNSFWLGKTLHVSVYATLALLAGWLPFSRPLRFALIALLVLHGGATEFIQQYTGRHPSWRDFGLDSAGILLGFCLGWQRWSGRGNSLGESPEIQLQQNAAGEHGEADHLRQREIA